MPREMEGGGGGKTNKIHTFDFRLIEARVERARAEFDAESVGIRLCWGGLKERMKDKGGDEAVIPVTESTALDRLGCRPRDSPGDSLPRSRMEWMEYSLSAPATALATACPEA